MTAADYEAQLSELRAKVDALSAEREHFHIAAIGRYCARASTFVYRPRR